LVSALPQPPDGVEASVASLITFANERIEDLKDSSRRVLH